ncbi:hypothetical protein WJ75_04535 [Burkholderia ubonensis]|nr:hypothetical protein WJ75_04535 [Burkholderia ubonensis]
MKPRNPGNEMNSKPISGLSAQERESLLRRALGEGLGRTASGAAPIAAVASSGAMPLSFAQQRMWFLSQLDGTGTAYHMDDGVRLVGDLDVAAFKVALDTLVARHGALRTRIVLVDGQPAQCVDEHAVGFPLAEEDLRRCADPDAALADAVRRNARSPFDLERGPLGRGLLLRTAEHTHVFLLTLHHIVCDGWSMGILSRELAAIYAAIRAGERVPRLPEPPVDYASYVEWQRRTLQGDAIMQQIAYWSSALRDAPALVPLPTDRPRTRPRQGDAANRPFSFEMGLVRRLRAACARRAATPYMAMLAAWAIVIARLSGERDVVIATPVANRTRVEIESIVGLFANTLAIRVDMRTLGPKATIDDVLKLVRTIVLDAQRCRDVPFEQVIEAVRPARQTGHAPLLQLMFAWQEHARQTLRVPGLEIVPFETTHRAYDSEIAVSVGDSGEDIAGHVAYAGALYDAETIDAFVGAWKSVLEAIVDDPSRPVDTILLMPEATRRQILFDWNAAASSNEDCAFVHRQVAARARAMPDSVAIVQDSAAFSYAELDARADRLARRLRAIGVGPDALVAIVAAKAPVTIAGMLAVLKAGGAYLPIDPARSGPALARALADGAPAAVLVDDLGRTALADIAPAVPVVDLGADDAVVDDAVAVPLHPGNLAYAVCTSGSTGHPKIVTVEHRNLSSLLCWQRDAYALAPGARTSSVVSLGFDAAALEIWTALCAGAELHLPPLRAKGLSIDEMLDWWRAQALDVSFLPTPIAEYAFAHGIAHPTLRTLFVGGDRLRTLPGELSAALVDLYGPSEATVLSIAGRVDLRRTRAVLGRPTPHGKIYVLDPYGEPLPVGIPGEIHIGGPCVSRGYLHDPARNAACFVPDPFSGEPGARLYRTGDRGRWLADGSIEFLGRNARQAKVAGMRVELSAIEASLDEHPAVREAVVVARCDDERGDGDATLVAYVLPAPGEPAPAVASLRDHLVARLPASLVPVAFVVLDAWPLGTNGKLDRSALPAPRAEDWARTRAAPPVDDFEIAIAKIWCELLGRPAVSRDDDFFELGGHSLQCAVMNQRLHAAFGVDVGIRYLYEYRTLKHIAERTALLCGEAKPHTGPTGERPSGTLEI